MSRLCGFQLVYVLMAKTGVMCIEHSRIVPALYLEEFDSRDFNEIMTLGFRELGYNGYVVGRARSVQMALRKSVSDCLSVFFQSE